MRPRWGRVFTSITTGTALALALLLLSACVATGPSASDPRLAGTWHLASGSDDGHDLPIGGRAITLTIGDSTHTGGDEPCSAYDATVTGGIGAVFVRVALTGGSRDECETTALNRLEQLYVSALGASRFAAISQGALILSSPSSNLVFLRTAPAPVAELDNSSWRLYSVGSFPPTVTASAGIHPVNLSFIGADEVMLSSPCFTTDAEYQLEGENFAISHIVSGPDLASGCTRADRDVATDTLILFDAPLLLDVSSDGRGSVPMLVITNVDDNLPIVFRAAN